MIVDIYRVSNDYPLESSKRILSDIRLLNMYSLALKRHYKNDSILSIIKNDTVIETIEYYYNRSIIRYISTNRLHLDYIKKYLSIRYLWSGPLSYSDYDTLDYYNLDSDLLF